MSLFRLIYAYMDDVLAISKTFKHGDHISIHTYKKYVEMKYVCKQKYVLIK